MKEKYIDCENRISDDEIISSLEVIATTRNCSECKIRNCKWGDCNCSQITADAALGLIERQKAEIERLEECPKCIYEYDGNTTEYCIQGPCSNFKTVEQIKSEAYREFAEHLKEKWFNNDYYSPDVDFGDFVDNSLKEVVGEEECLVKIVCTIKGVRS